MKHDLPTRPGDEFRFIEVEGHRLRVFTRDLEKAGPPLVICNGLGQAVEMLLPMMDELPDRPIITFDAAGVGRSDTPDVGASMQQHALMLRAVLDALDVEQFDILGISWGGALAQQIAHDMPDRCRKLVLAITSAGGIASWWGSPVALAEIMFPWRYFSKAYGDFIGPFMYGGEAILHPELFREYSRHAIRPSYEGYSAQVKAMCSWSSLPWLHQLKQPTQIIAGAGDTLIPIPNQILLASLIPNAKLQIYPAGHLVMYSRRAEIGQLVTGFLNAA
ncbi:alpha/beta fold hydrolase (plasmid) [Pseudorhodobacter turbinis]|uniref:Alpha/beta fold hydrolase n=1 Tax=Pseudorhodobacter turbinis TaxID=2500533 RepID=A0A4P8EL53_9RHOB|nr:alpha/beta hydrolase [Pseudorhodobacter turbinis]QCO57719.1 alpha/beta fold hydrolase [Pseudorhodobacter turbinis]